ESRSGHPRDRVDVDVELGPDEGVDVVEAAVHGGGVTGGPADRLIGLVGIAHTDRDAGTRAVFHVTTSLGAARSGQACSKRGRPQAPARGPDPGRDLDRGCRGERAASWAARRTGPERDLSIAAGTPDRI